MSQIQTASQKRIQHIARRFAETGLKRLVKGVYSCMRECLQQHIRYVDGSTFRNVDVQSLPRNMECEIFLDLGENSNSNLITKYTQIGNSILPALNEQGAGMAVKTDAPAVLATKLIEAMGIDSNDFLEDYTTDGFKEKAAKAVEQQSQMAQEAKALDARKIEADAALAEANVAFTGAQTKNTSDDNAKQLAVAIDKHHQEWADLTIKAGREGIQLPDRPGFNEILLLAKQILQSQEQQAPQQPAEEPQPQQPQEQVI